MDYYEPMMKLASEHAQSTFCSPLCKQKQTGKELPGLGSQVAAHVCCPWYLLKAGMLNAVSDPGVASRMPALLHSKGGSPKQETPVFLLELLRQRQHPQVET